MHQTSKRCCLEDDFRTTDPVTVAGTVGAGDACMASLIHGITKKLPVHLCAQGACAVAACCVEGIDAVSGIVAWNDTLRRFGITRD